MIKTGKELAEACAALAEEKTLYVLGCFGAPLTSRAKERYIGAQSYNRKTERVYKINSATPDTFGFDCVGMIKGLLWGWNGSENAVYGGADYGSNGVPDINADQMIKVSKSSTDFSSVCVGEVVWKSGHIGVYIGDGLCVECTPAWDDGCQITAVANMGGKQGYNGRYWTKHGKLPYVTYEESAPAPEIGYTQDLFIREIQMACGAKVDGIAGAETLNKTPTLSRSKNASHNAVLPVQRTLKRMGLYTDALDGHFGANTARAVTEYQKHIGNKIPDGEITAGMRTWKHLLGVE